MRTHREGVLIMYLFVTSPLCFGRNSIAKVLHLGLTTWKYYDFICLSWLNRSSASANVTSDNSWRRKQCKRGKREKRWFSRQKQYGISHQWLWSSRQIISDPRGHLIDGRHRTLTSLPFHGALGNGSKQRALETLPHLPGEGRRSPRAATGPTSIMAAWSAEWRRAEGGRGKGTINVFVLFRLYSGIESLVYNRAFSNLIWFYMNIFVLIVIYTTIWLHRYPTHLGFS